MPLVAGDKANATKPRGKRRSVASAPRVDGIASGPRASAREGVAPQQATSPQTDSEETQNLEAHHRRLKSVAAILDETFGKWAESKPDLWERRAYLLLVGLVYERLATDPELSTDELIKLAKALAENRRVEARTEKDRVEPNASDAGEPADSSGQLPTRLAEAVRQVYGANLHVPEPTDHD